MKPEAETRHVVESYFAAWTHKKAREAHGYLAEDLEFSGPNVSIKGAEAFWPALEGFAAMASGARLLELVVEGNRAAMLYDCDLPPPVGTLRISAFFRVENGKIRTYDTRLDNTELGKLLAQKS